VLLIVQAVVALVDFVQQLPQLAVVAHLNLHYLLIKTFHTQ
jgi:hypothetical protein